MQSFCQTGESRRVFVRVDFSCPAPHNIRRYRECSHRTKPLLQCLVVQVGVLPSFARKKLVAIWACCHTLSVSLPSITGGLSTHVALMVRVELGVSAKSGIASSAIGTQIVARNHRSIQLSHRLASCLICAQICNLPNLISKLAPRSYQLNSFLSSCSCKVYLPRPLPYRIHWR